jgi:transcriptional regulator with XRE-family HTH domain
MYFGERLTQVRKRKNLSQADVGKKIGINGDAYGRYERNEVRPTIEMALKIAQALDVSLDYLTGNSDLELDKNAVNRIQELSKLPEKDQDYIYVTLDALIRDFKNKQAFGINH